MAQTIKLKRSSQAGHLPASDNLVLGELAINTTDGKVFMLRGDGNVVNIAGESYTAGEGINISDSNVISAEGLAAGGNVFAVQVNDGTGKLSFVPPQAAGRVLTSQGTDQVPTWEPVPVSGGTVRSVGVSGGDTGMTFSPEAITTTGTITMAGTLGVEHGGTGKTTLGEVIESLLPDQAGHEGGMLKTDGEGNLMWEVPPGSNYTAGVGLVMDGTTINSTVADNTGIANKITVTKGDGTLVNLDAGTAGQVLVSKGDAAVPTWENVNGTVSKVAITRTPSVGMYISGGTATVDPLTNEITDTGTIGLTGVLSVANGGTGADTVVDARTGLLPAQAADTSGKFLMSNGTDVAWGTPSGLGGTVTSVEASGGTTGLSFSGSPITEAGTLTLGGTLNIASGGTGGTTAAEACANLLPVQADNANKVLMTNGTDVSWGIPAGMDGTVTSVAIDGGETGLTFGGGPIVSAGTFTVGGTLNVANGGTGVESMQELQTAVLPTQTAETSGKFLSTKNGVVSWDTPPASGGTVTSVNVSGGTTGLSFSGGPIVDSGTLNMSGALNVTNGGTGANNAKDAINALVPAQTGNANKILTTNGTEVAWTTSSAGTVTSVAVSGGTTGLSFSGGPIVDSGSVTMTGTLGLANGGTGGTSAETARNNILPPQATHAGQVLVTDGTNATWSDAVGTGTVTSVGINPGTTGLTFSGGPITTDGEFRVGGVLSIASGGTGASNANAAFQALVPTQTNLAGTVMSTNGTSASWTRLSDLTFPAAGSNKQVTYNKAGIPTGSNSLTFDEQTFTAMSLSVSGTDTVIKSNIDITGGSRTNTVALTDSAIDLSKGSVFKYTSTANKTWTFVPPVTNKSYIFALSLDNGGQFVQTWPTTVRWPNGSAPTLSVIGTDVLIFFTDNGGTTWRGSAITNYTTN